ncbi:MAG: cytochrome c [Rhizobiaceae bacterium]
MKKTTILTAFLVSTAAITLAFAHGGATGIVKQRMDGMMAMGKSLGAVADMFKGKRQYDAEIVAQSADTLKQHAVEIETLFPDSKASREGKATEALPEIWQRNDEFMAIAAQLVAAADQLKLVAGSSDQQAARQAFAGVAKTCSTCHRDFRKPKN